MRKRAFSILLAVYYAAPVQFQLSPPAMTSVLSVKNVPVVEMSSQPILTNSYKCIVILVASGDIVGAVTNGDDPPRLKYFDIFMIIEIESCHSSVPRDESRNGHCVRILPN